MKITDWRIGSRLAAGFGAVLVLTAAMAAVGIAELRSLTQAAQRKGAADSRYAAVERWSGATNLNLTRALTVARSGWHAPTVAYLEPQMKATSERITVLQKSVEQQLAGDVAQALFADVSAKRKAYIDVRAQAATAFKDGRADDGARITEGPMTAGAEAYLAAIEALQQQAHRESEALEAEIVAVAAGAQRTMVGLGLLALLLGCACAGFITRSVTRPLARAIGSAERIAANDLSQPVDDAGRGDEIGTLQRSLAAMQASLTRVVREMRDGTASVANASREIAQASTDLSARTEHGASSLQETAAAVEQIASTVSHTAESAGTADQLVASANGVAQRGGSITADVVATMERIQTGSRKIAEITGVIDGIAFQTNILALNAAVEAARAGDQGRGFAVVASEVRSLAQRSADAAREIKSLIGSSVEQVEAGSALVGSAGGTMQDIVASVQRVADIVGSVRTAAVEQSSSIGHVSTAVAELDRMTQQNSALVEQTAAAAESLKEQAARLAALADTFNLGDDSAAQAALVIRQAAGSAAAGRVRRSDEQAFNSHSTREPRTCSSP